MRRLHILCKDQEVQSHTMIARSLPTSSPCQASKFFGQGQLSKSIPLPTADLHLPCCPPTMLTGSLSTLPGSRAPPVSLALVTIFSHPSVPHPQLSLS